MRMRENSLKVTLYNDKNYWKSIPLNFLKHFKIYKDLGYV